MPRRSGVIPIALLLSGCAPIVDGHSWLAGKYKDSAPSLFESAPKPRQPDPRPDVKAIIGRDITAVFGRTNVKDVKVGSPRPNGYGWLACLRADVASITNRDIGTQYFVVEIDGGRVGLRRPATAADQCETEKFEPI
jgi:hypothetical protein